MAVNVAIVFAPDFSARLHQLAFHTPVWIMETPANRAAAEEAWLRRQEWPHIDVTLFQYAHDWRSLFAQIVLRHEAVDSLDIIGAPPDDEMRTALAEEGFQRIQETAEGIRARKT